MLNRDIAIYLELQFCLLHEYNLLLDDNDDTGLIQHLVEGADGMFLWARLMIAYLNSPALTPKQRMETIFKTMPEGLEEMYARILGLVRKLDSPSQNLARRVFMWVAYARCAMNSAQSCEVISATGTEDGDTNRLVDVDHAMIVSCAGLVEKRQCQTFHFIHLTARYFTSSAVPDPQLGKTFVLSE